MLIRFSIGRIELVIWIKVREVERSSVRKRIEVDFVIFVIVFFLIEIESVRREGKNVYVFV